MCGHWVRWVWSLGQVCVVTGSGGCGHWVKWVWSLGQVGVVTGLSGCDQSMGEVGVVTGCGQWVVDVLFTT